MKLNLNSNSIPFQLLFIAFIGLMIVSCSRKKTPLEVATEPAQKLITSLGEQEYSIVLHDMDVTEDNVNIIYNHKYAILKKEDGEIVVDSTEWEHVSEAFFMKHEKNLGLELVSRHDGSFSSTPKPVGFDWAIGNPKYGEWVVDSSAVATTSGTQEKTWRYNSGSRFFLMYWMFSRPTSYGTYNNYANTARGRSAFYGSGKSTYGTNSSYNKTNRSAFYSRKAGNTAWNKTYNSRKTSKSSRYKGGSSSRGRSGGFGK